MSGRPRYVTIARVTSVAGLVLTAGCGSHPINLSETDKAQLGTIGVVAPHFAPNIALDTPETGTGGAAGQGALQGMGALWSGCAQFGNATAQLGGGILALFVCPILTPIAAAGGAIIGEVKAAPKADVEQAKQNIGTAFAQVRIQETLRESVYAAAKSNSSYAIVNLPERGPSAPDEPVDYRPLAGEGVTTVLEVSVANLVLQGSGGHQPLKLAMTARARLISVSENRELTRGGYTYRSEQRPFSEWIASDAQALRAAYERAYQNIAMQIAQTFLRPGSFFPRPISVAIDNAGNLYLADSDNNRIRKITPAGVATTLAGTAGTTGSTDAIGAAARFKRPNGVATDSAGNVYVADSGNHTIRKITPAGVVTTLAGTVGVSGSTDAAGAAASFNSPGGVATDSEGNVYVADSGSSTIRKITPAGVVTTLAGTAGTFGSTDATGPAAVFNSPDGVAIDSAGNVYVVDSGNSTIRKITPAGAVTTLAGTTGVSGSTDATGPAASFSFPHGVATDIVGNVYVADSGNNTIRKITPAGVVTTLAGTAGASGSTDATGPAASFNFPLGVATDSAGNVYVADTFNQTIRKITPPGAVSTIVGPTGQATFARALPESPQPDEWQRSAAPVAP